MMSKKIILIISLEIFFSPSFLLSQTNDSIKMNRISLQTGLFHIFFDGAPLTNAGYTPPSSNKLFNGLLINSYGVKYDKVINTKSSISFEIMYLEETYKKYDYTIPLPYPVSKVNVLDRTFMTCNINYNRSIHISKHINFVCGAGVNYRSGSESLIVGSIPINSIDQESPHRPVIDVSVKNDFGLNTFYGIDYTPVEWLTFYTKIDFMTLFYINDKEAIKRFKENYINVPSHFPSRYDLSLRFGVGINF